MKNLMKEISNQKSIDDSLISSYGKNLNDLEDEWKNTLLLIDGNKPLFKVNETESTLIENGSCGGGEMSFETMIISALLLTIFVKKLRLNP